MTVAIGNRNGTGLYDDPGNVSFSLLANGVPFTTQEVTNGTVPNGTFEDFTLTYETPPSASIIGDSLTIQLATLPEQGSAYQAGFDNVTLNETTIEAAPEPSTTMLLLLGGATLVALTALCCQRVPPIGGTVAIAFIALGLTSASADPVDVPDNSFESGQGWTHANPEIVPGWIFNAPAGSSYGSLFVGACFTSPGLSSGNDFAFIDNNGSSANGFLTSADSLGTIAADMTNTLTVALGNPEDAAASTFGAPGVGPLEFDPVYYAPPAGVSLALLANGQPLATDYISPGAVASGSWQNFTFSYTTTDFDPVVGEQLTIRLGTESDASGQAEDASFDNVQLNATANNDVSGGGGGNSDGSGSNLGTTPEPPSWGLLGIGFAALGSVMRWKRARHNYCL